MKKLLIALFAISFFSGCNNVVPKYLVLINGNIITLNPQQPRAENLAISGNKIVYVGSGEGLDEYKNSHSAILDLNGKTLIPGFIDAHAHLTGLGDNLLTLNLASIKTWDEAVEIVKSAVQNSAPGEWIIGDGWHQEKWISNPDPNVMGYPVHTAISRISPENPVILEHASGHAVFVNAKAMELAGINDQTTDPAGGQILRDQNGSATGILIETATNLVQKEYQDHIRRLPAEKQKQRLIKTINRAIEHCLKNGVTTFHDAGASYELLDLYKELAHDEKLAIRIWAMISEKEHLTTELLRKYRTIGYGNNFLTIRAIKKYIDGALGSRGAWLIEPYEDMPSTHGQNITSLDEIERVARLAYKEDYQMCTHAIGDRGNREMLNIYQKFLKGPNNKRWRIEHAQHLSATDIPRFAKLGIIASMQTVHCTSDGPWVAKRIGNGRAKEGAYVWQKLLATGVSLANGTDCPVEKLSPIENYYAAVTRKLKNKEYFYPDQALTREQGLKSLTIWNAYAGFEEKIKGSIEKGTLADMVVLSQDITTVPENEILNTAVDITIVNGKIMFKR